MLLVAEKYASVGHLREVEGRLIDRLNGIDAKLDRAIAEGR
jgi:hypothetical protein